MKVNQLLLFCLAICGFGTSLATSETSSSAAVKKMMPVARTLHDLDSIVDEALREFNVPGVAIGIVVDGKVVLAKGYGYRNVDKRLPVTENTLFAIGSCTKAFTSFLLGQLVEEGKISWDDPVITRIPEFRLMDRYATHHLTIRDLAAHRTGIPRHDFLWINSAFTRADVISSLRHLEPVCPLREEFQYNNVMYTVAGILVEKVTGKTWEEALSSRILIPLGMLDSNASVKEMQKNENYSIPYANTCGKIKAIPFRDLHSVAPAGAINSSVSDMLKWVQLQLSDGTHFSNQLIRKKSLQEMHKIHMPVASPPDEEIYSFGYGLGWGIGIYRGHYYLSHDGGIDGFVSQISLIPKKKIGVVLLSNSSSDGAYLVTSIANTIIDKLLGKTDSDWIEKMKCQREQIKNAQLEAPVENHAAHAVPSHNLKDYVGCYTHPAYGIVQVKLENNRLLAIYGEVIFPLNHETDDIFNGKIDETCFEEKFTLSFSFSTNRNGEICKLLVLLEPSVKPIVFKKA